MTHTPDKPRRKGPTGLHARFVEPYQRALEHHRFRPPADSDALIAARVHRGDAAAFQAIVVRHRPAVAAYLRTCTADPHTAEDLTDRTFARAFAAAARGSDPTMSWRLHLLATARGLAVRAWGHRPDTFAAPFRTWADTGGTWSLESRSRLAEAYRLLPERWQTVLWHTVVEGEGRAVTLACLGLRREEYGRFTSRARTALHEAYLELHQRTAESSAECVRYGALLATALTGSSYGTDRTYDGSVAYERKAAYERIADHLAGCALCREAYTDLSDLDAQLRAQLPPLLLGWWPGPEYRELRAAQPVPARPPAFLAEAVRTAARERRRRRALRHHVTSRRAAVCLLTLALGTWLSLSLYESLVRPAPPHALGEQPPLPPQDPDTTHSALPGSPEPTRTTPSTAPVVPPRPGATQRPRPTPTPPLEPAGYEEPQLLDATGPIPAEAFTLHTGTTAGPDGTRTLPSGTWLRYDNVDFGTTAKHRAHLRLAAPAAPGTQLTLRLDDSATPAALATLSGTASPDVSLTEGTTGIHTVLIEVTCAGTDPCLRLASTSFTP
ncbi:sigma factor [Streptomyces sp. NPDC050418]|uniref:sigma factor n=1 Tax=Streptomyces sp. NPDC050418 TaxID=3365612 RepID=UPI0037A189B9